MGRQKFCKWDKHRYQVREKLLQTRSNTLVWATDSTGNDGHILKHVEEFQGGDPRTYEVSFQTCQKLNDRYWIECLGSPESGPFGWNERFTRYNTLTGSFLRAILPSERPPIRIFHCRQRRHSPKVKLEVAEK